MFQERKHKKIIIIKNYLKKNHKPSGFQLAKPVLLVFFAAANSGALAQLFSVPNQHLGSLRTNTPVPPAPGPTGSGTHVPPGHGCAGPSVICTLPGACGLRSLELQSPWCTPPRERWMASGWRLELLLEENSPKCP